MSFLRQIVAVILISLTLGILIEWAQAGTQRTADVLDVLRDLVGTFVAVTFFAPDNKTLPKSHLRTFQAATIIMVSFAVFPFVKAVADEYLARTQFPLLSDFETPFEISRWSGNATLSIDTAVHYSGKSSLKIALNTSKYSGTSLKYFPGNWIDYKSLQLSIYNPSKEPLTIITRIHDRRHIETGQAYADRFNKKFALKEGWNKIVIPLQEIANAPRNRKLNLEMVQEIGVFVHRLAHPRIIYIDSVVLTR
jgi:hypothetical protein